MAVFGIVSLIALSGADWPPPPGFLGLEAVLAGVSYAVYLRVGRRLANRRAGGRTPPAALEGLLAGLVVGLILAVFSPGEPTVVPTVGDRLTWLAVMAATGALAAQAIWGLALAASGRLPHTPP